MSLILPNETSVANMFISAMKDQLQVNCLTSQRRQTVIWWCTWLWLCMSVHWVHPGHAEVKKYCLGSSWREISAWLCVVLGLCDCARDNISCYTYFLLSHSLSTSYDEAATSLLIRRFCYENQSWTWMRSFSEEAWRRSCSSLERKSQAFPQMSTPPAWIFQLCFFFLQMAVMYLVLIITCKSCTCFVDGSLPSI